jgi:hypothetical protein
MHPNDVVPAQRVVELPGELLVHPEIAGCVAFRQIGEIETIMTDRPQHPVGETMIILLDIAARKVGHRIGERSKSPPLGRERALLAGFARPAKPKSTACLERCLERDGKSSRRGGRRR